MSQRKRIMVLAGVLAAFYERVSVGHVEAGLRTFDFDAPWPEEMNRCLADRIVEEVALLLDDAEEYARRAQITNPYGDGLAAKRIVDALSQSDIA